MMFGLSRGQRVSKKAAVGTSAVTLATSTQKMLVTLESITFCNPTGGSLNVSLFVDTGSSQFYVYNEKPVASKDTLFLSGHAVALQAGETLKVVASGANISVIAVVIQSNPSEAAEGAPTTLSFGAGR